MSEPAPDARLDAFPDAVAGRDPQRVALVMGGSDVTLSYGSLVCRSRQVAHLLRSRGVRRGGSIAILMDNLPHYLEVAWGAQRAGLRYTAIGSRLTAAEVQYILADSGASVLFTSSRCAEVAREAASGAPAVSAVICVDSPVPGLEDYSELLSREPATPVDDEAEGVDLLYSSGTTGRPKGVEATLELSPIGTAPAVAALLQALYGFDRDTVYLSPAPLYHAAPLRFCMSTQRFGGKVVVMEKFDPVAMLELIERHRVTHVQMVPTMFIRLLKLPAEDRNRFDLSSLRTVVHAAAPCPPEIKRRMIDWLGPIVHEYYSSTEGYLFTAITPDEALQHPGSVGKPLLGIPHVLDDQGNELPPGEPGTIWSENGIAFTYRNDPEKTSQAHNRNGWTTVGDIGYLDEHGYLYLTDRKADMIIAGGVNIYPQEAENVLATHPDVVDVAVFGIPHPELGEEVKAVVQPSSMAEAGPELEAALLVFCHDRLAKYKTPRSIDFAAELPRSPTGKLYKRILRDAYSR